MAFKLFFGNTTADGAVTHTGVVAVAATAVIAGAGSVLLAGVSATTATATVSAAGSSTLAGISAPSANATVSPTGNLFKHGVTTNAATAVISANGIITLAGATPLSSSAVISAAGNLLKHGAVATASTATVSSTGNSILVGATDAAATALVSATASGTAEGVASISSTATVSANGVVSLLGVAPLSATAAMSAAGSLFKNGAVDTASTATVNVVGSLAAVLGAAPLAATATVDSASTLTLAAAALLSSNAVITAVGTATPAVPTVYGEADFEATAAVSPTGISYSLISRDFRFRNDDGDEASATWAQPLNTELPDISEDVNYRVRFSIENTGLAASSIINNGHLEVSEDGGAYRAMGTDAYTSPLVIPPHSLNTVSTLTTLEDMDDNGGCLFVDSGGIWHLAYREWTDGLFSTYRIVIKVSITSGQTWHHHEFDLDGEDIREITEDTTGAILVITTSYIIRSTNGGLTWSAPVSRPLATYFTFFVTINNDYIIADNFDMKYYISSDLGSTWDTYQNNDFPAALTLNGLQYELDASTGDLTVWYLGYTSNDDPVSMFRWIDTYPYSGFPNLSEDDISQRLFIGTSDLEFAYQTSTARFVRLDTHFGSSMSVILYANAWNSEPNTSIVETPELGADTYAFKAIDYIAPAWDATSGGAAPNIRNIREGLNGELVQMSLSEFGFAGSTEQLRTPSIMGWYLYGDTKIDSIQYSPSVNKWYGVTTSTSKTITCYEFEWSSEDHGTHTTQQISSGSYVADNYGYTDHNRIYPTDIPAGEKVEYEYAFRLRPTENIAGKTICVRPSGIYQHDNIACFTIPVGHAALAATANTTVVGSSDSPSSILSGTAVDSFTGSVLRGAVTNLPSNATVAVAASVIKTGVIELVQPCILSATAWVEHAADCDMLANANLTLASTNTKTFACDIVATATASGGTPGNEIHVESVLSVSCTITPAGRLSSDVPASLHSTSLLRAKGSVDKLHIDSYIYKKDYTLTIVQEAPLQVYVYD